MAGRRIFLTVGIAVAVFGMRILFPLLIVGITAGLSPGAAVELALHNGDHYGELLHQAHPAIAAFGGMFLLMLFLDVVFEERDVSWLGWIERPLARIGKLDQLPVVVAPVFLFLYLEVLDASFSFDGVIGAFAITSDPIVIAIGLGIGAMFIRSLTIYLVNKGTLGDYVYLTHGAHWAIGALAALLLMSMKHEIPEVVTGLIGVGFIAAAFGSSLVRNRRTVSELAPATAHSAWPP
jgi:uncharacterized protein